jgi:hypothetical protein
MAGLLNAFLLVPGENSVVSFEDYNQDSYKSVCRQTKRKRKRRY